MAHHSCVFVKLMLIFCIDVAGVASQNTKKLTVVSNCSESVWPAIYPGENVSGTFDELKQGKSAVFNVPCNWQGRVWCRTGCKFDANGTGSCQTGGCGSLRECNNSGSPLASIAQFTLGDNDYYGVNLMEGFNLQMVVTELEGEGNCPKAGCDADLRESCPSQLALKSNSNGAVIACRGACNVSKKDSSCCTTGERCRPLNYSQTFRSACPAATIYQQDELTSTINCAASEYVVSFCTTRNDTKCSYHGDKISCKGSSGSTTLSAGWWAVITLLTILLTTQI